MPNLRCSERLQHDPHSWGDLEWCDGAGASVALIDELVEAEKGNIHARECQACEALERVAEDARPAVERALAGTIGQKTLAAILTRNGFPVGARAINRHRREGHAP